MIIIISSSQLQWSQVYRQQPRRLEKICRQPMFLMELRTLLLLLLLLYYYYHHHHHHHL